ncbi:MAG: DMT family transporter [Pseudonocardiales bacterium]|nr:DMT family transporter [Hyphomicrobiales bacterium]MBV8825527.1 DMT family transporter [Hyphomicrobiales bacterium]MBV9429453.1 DMT family transporter [Bradyrhizobiaceae bacterium]MBV9728121.1 DMT family transporter [Pseudonocardiales bacterium]
MTGRMIAMTLLICALWASVGVAIKFSLDSAPPLGLAAVRMWVAAAALWLWMAPRWPKRSDWATWRVVMVAASFYCLLLAFTHVGFNHVAAARGIVLLNTTPLFVALLANFIMPREPLGFVKSAGLLLAFVGVVAIFAHRLDATGGSAFGEGIMLLAAVSWGFQTLWTKRAARDVHPAALNLIQFIAAAAVLSVVSMASEPIGLWRPTASLAFAIVYLAIAGTVVAWLLWFRVLQQVPASTASAFIFTVPLVGVVLSFLLLGEPITLQFALGAGLVSAGIVVVSRASALANGFAAWIEARGRGRAHLACATASAPAIAAIPQISHRDGQKTRN